MTEPVVLIVPGLRDHVAEHWQTHLEARIPNARTVPRMERDKLSRAAWVEALDRCLADIAGPVVLVAHSAGVMITVHWAARHARPIKGALLATPPDFERPLPDGYPKQGVLLDNGWLPTPRGRLPFRSIVASSSNDPLCDADRARSLAMSWGSTLIELGAVGHLNPAAGFGPWPRAEALVRDLSQ